MTQPLAVELLNVIKRFGDVIAVNDVSLSIEDGEFFSLLGPSGCGKTTTLRMIAGLEQVTEGEIIIKGQPVAGIPAHKRPVNTVFQSYALFPHMTAAQNVAFGLEMKKVPKSEIATRVAEALSLVQLPHMSDRKPKQLSGGQQQRVALARALVNRPKVLLLDEPLGALDLKLRKAMQLELKQIQAEVGITFIYVTHDQEEAITMSDRVAVMSDGVVQHVGTPREIYERPANRYVADFIGETNFVEGTVTDLGEYPSIMVGETALMGAANGRDLQRGQKVTLAVRPEKISLYPQGTIDITESGIDPEEFVRMFGTVASTGSVEMRDYLKRETNNVVVDGLVQEVIYIGTDTRYRVSFPPDVELFVRMQNYGSRYDTTFSVGDEVYVHWAAENAQILLE